MVKLTGQGFEEYSYVPLAYLHLRKSRITELWAIESRDGFRLSTGRLESFEVGECWIMSQSYSGSSSLCSRSRWRRLAGFVEKKEPFNVSDAQDDRL